MADEGAFGIRVPVLGVPVTLYGMDETVSAVRVLLQQSEPHLVVTADSQGIYLAQTDPELMAIYQSSTIATPDSNGVVWALGRKNARVPRVTGVDLMDHLCEMAAKDGFSVYLLGAAPGIAQEAAGKLQQRYPGLTIAGVRDGFFTLDQEDEIVAEVASTRPDLLFVAMGIPRQEKFLARNRNRLGFKVGIGVGGSFDVFSGRVKRAPRVIQALRMEWLWRLLLNPKKASKVATLPKFALCVLREKE